MTITSLVQHAPHPWFDVVDDCLMLGGRSITELATAVGTPFYAYDRNVMTRKVRMIRESLPADIELHYAIKANPMPEVVTHMLGLVDGLDVASAGELAIALQAGASPTGVSFAGPGKTALELEEATTAGITMNVESERELRILADIGRRTGHPPSIAIRVNPDFELKTSGMKMGGGPKQFGIDSERVPDVLSVINTLPVEFRGFHIFCGSQNLRPDAIIESHQKSVALAMQLSEASPAPIRTLNIGGGFGIPYFPGELPLELGPIGANLQSLQQDLHRRLPGVRLILELGRYLVGEAGIYVCRVLDRKVSRGHVFLVTDGGLHHHLAASGNFGQVIRKNYPVVIGNRITGTTREIASVVGPLCTPLDLLADRMNLARAEEGDLVAVLQSGAYGLTSSPLRFLSHPTPKELIL